jgi:hypothetical protein
MKKLIALAALSALALVPAASFAGEVASASVLLNGTVLGSTVITFGTSDGFNPTPPGVKTPLLNLGDAKPGETKTGTIPAIVTTNQSGVTVVAALTPNGGATEFALTSGGSPVNVPAGATPTNFNVGVSFAPTFASLPGLKSANVAITAATP